MAVAASIALGLVFLVAGGAKLASPSWPAQARELGAPTFVSRTLPWCELGLGAGLLTGLARRPLAVAGAALLLGFTALLGLRLAQGRRPPCACFGGRSPRPIGPWSVARNLGFLALAAIAIAA